MLCPECGRNMVLKSGKFGFFYGCSGWPRCSVAHGVHQATGEPLGTPADKDTRALRVKAHEAFDGLWRSHGVHRATAYRWLGRVMGLGKGECHIGLFDKSQCERVVFLCENYGRIGK